MTDSPARSLALLALLSVLAVLGFRSWDRSVTTLAVQALCSQAEQGNWTSVLETSIPRKANEDELRTASECRCLALHATDQSATCNSELEAILGDEPEDRWAPLPPLSEGLVRARKSRGAIRAAAALAQRASTAFPNHLGLRILELETRIAVEEPSAVLNSLEQRLPSDPVVRQQFRIWLADQSRQLGLAERAITLLGPAPGPGIPGQLFAWHEQRTRALARLGRSAELQSSVTRWMESSPLQADVRALYALILEEERLEPAEGDVASLLVASADEVNEIVDPWIREAIYRRVIMGLAAFGQPAQALAWYDQAREEFPLEGLERSELEREASRPASGLPEGGERPVAVRFVLESPAPGATIALSPPAGHAVDEPWSSHPIPSTGTLVLDRMADNFPQRWVLRAEDGQVLGSGAAWVREGAEVRIVPRSTEPSSGRPEPTPAAAADGQHKLFVILPDCGDWRLIQYLRMRGELPTLDRLLDTGYRAVLDSNPPFTGAALRSLVYPSGNTSSSVLSVLHELGAELEGLASVPSNPLDSLRWFLARDDDLFATLGRGPLRAANLLYAHGNLAAGHHARVVGPEGTESQLPVLRSSRPLSADEATAFPLLAGLPMDVREHVERIAAEMDAASQIAQSEAADVVLLRLESLDLLTHSRYGHIAGHKQDNGAGALFDAYRYMDNRLGQLRSQLDADDTLIVVSDHGIQTAMKHSRQAFFVAVGPGIPEGRAPGSPHFRGLAQVVARLAGVETTWPDTGILAGLTSESGQ